MTQKYIILISIISIIFFYAPVLLLTEDTLLSLTKEDGLYEYLGASFFFVASIVFLSTFLKAKNRNAFLLLFALAFFFAAGEEISWGQRILDFNTPPVIEAYSAQGEFNFHNLDFIQHETGIGSSIKGLFLSFNRLFILFWMIYCILIPFADGYSSRLRSLFLRIRLPIISIWYGMLFLLNEITSKTLELFVVVGRSKCPEIYEIKESIWALLVLLWSADFFFRYVLRKVQLPCALTHSD